MGTATNNRHLVPRDRLHSRHHAHIEIAPAQHRTLLDVTLQIRMWRWQEFLCFAQKSQLAQLCRDSQARPIMQRIGRLNRNQTMSLVDA